MPVGDERQVRVGGDWSHGSAIANGPPDTETLDRRRVNPPAGCRAATEPAIVLIRRSCNDIPATTPAIRPARMAGSSFVPRLMLDPAAGLGRPRTPIPAGS